jgi:cysteine synthase B
MDAGRLVGSARGGREGQARPGRSAATRLVPRVGIEPTLLAERDFESRASTDFATGAVSAKASILPWGRRGLRQWRHRDWPQKGGAMPRYLTLEDTIGRTPLVRLARLPGLDIEQRGNVILAKLEGNNPAGSVKDRPAISMIRRAEERGEIHPGDTLIEATSGNTGIALAMAAAIRGYRMLLIMPEDLSVERAQTMKAFGAELILTPKAGGMEYARDLAEKMQREGKGRVLDQFANADNPRIHVETTGPEIWDDTEGRVTHFVSAMGTTGTITGVSRYLKERNPAVRIVGAQPSEGSRIPGIRKWPEAYLPKIYEPSRVDETVSVSQSDAEEMARRMAREEGLFAGISSGGACWAALEVARTVENATIVFVVCDRGDRYLSTGVFPA